MLEGKRIIVTGAAQGIGAVLAKGFANMGARVMLADVADPTSAASQIGTAAHAVQMDVTSLEDCARMVAETEAAFGGVDGLVNNAALFASLPIETQDRIEPSLWDKVMAVNVKGPWLCTRAVVPAMERAGGGSIVMIASNRIFQGVFPACFTMTPRRAPCLHDDSLVDPRTWPKQYPRQHDCPRPYHERRRDRTRRYSRPGTDDCRPPCAGAGPATGRSGWTVCVFP